VKIIEKRGIGDREEIYNYTRKWMTWNTPNIAWKCRNYQRTVTRDHSRVGTWKSSHPNWYLSGGLQLQIYPWRVRIG
jgi:hypothetical protein